MTWRAQEGTPVRQAPQKGSPAPSLQGTPLWEADVPETSLRWGDGGIHPASWRPVDEEGGEVGKVSALLT